jgi:hypothetical protein
MVAKKPGTPGRARSSRKAIAQGVPDVSALPDYLVCVSILLHTSLRVRPAPGIPCALCLFGRRFHAKLGQIMPRECGGVSLPSLSDFVVPDRPWIDGPTRRLKCPMSMVS